MISVEDLARKDLSNLSAMVSYAADILLHGTFSQRRPDLGKMGKCLGCGRRRRMSAKCCNTEYTKTQRAWTPELGFHQEECSPRMMDKPFGKKFLKRMQRQMKLQNGQGGATHNDGRQRKLRIRELILDLMKNEERLKRLALEMHVKVPDQATIPAFGEKYFLWREERARARFRKQQDVSRRINRGLEIGGTRPVFSNLLPQKEKKESKNE